MRPTNSQARTSIGASMTPCDSWARWLFHEPGLGRLPTERERGKRFRSEVDGEDREDGEREWHEPTGEREHEERHDLRRRVGEDVEDEFPHVRVDPAPLAHRGHDRREVVVGEDHRRRLACHVGAARGPSPHRCRRCATRARRSPRRPSSRRRRPASAGRRRCGAWLPVRCGRRRSRPACRAARRARARSWRPDRRRRPCAGLRRRSRSGGRSLRRSEDGHRSRAGCGCRRSGTARPRRSPRRRGGSNIATVPRKQSERSASDASSGSWSTRRLARPGCAAPGVHVRRSHLRADARVSRVSGSSRPSAAITVEHRGSSASGAPFVCTQRPSSQSSMVDISLIDGSKWNWRRRCRGALLGAHVSSEPRRGAAATRAPSDRHSVRDSASAARSALLHRTTVLAKALSAASCVAS